MQFQLADLFERLVDAAPQAQCLAAGEVHHTRGSLDERANRLARHLVAHGLGSGDHVGLYSYNRAEFIEVMIACWKIGAVPININYRYVVDELRYIVDDADLVAMIAERSFIPNLEPLAAEFPALAHYLVLEDGTSHEPAGFTAQTYEDALGAQPASRLPDAKRSADDVYLLYTGGTTGMPKGVMWRHEDIFFAAYGGGNYLEPISRPEDITCNDTDAGFPMSPLALAPLMHGGGQWITFIGIFSGGRSTVYTERHFDARRVLELVAAEQPTTMAIVGDAMGRPIAETMLDPTTTYDASSLLTIGNGGAMLSKSVREQLQQAFDGVIISDSFGATETGGAGTQIDQQGYTDGPRFDVGPDTAVLDPDTLAPIEAGTGARGMLARTGHIPLGYWKDPDKTAATFRTDGNDRRWVIPGDWATVDESGRVVLFGRGSMSINSGGEKIYPEEVESVIRSHPDVYDALVCGVPDERWGERVVALVQLRAGADAPGLAEIQDHCRGHLAGYKVPRDVVLGPVQRTNVGKPDYVWAKQRARDALGPD